MTGFSCSVSKFLLVGSLSVNGLRSQVARTGMPPRAATRMPALISGSDCSLLTEEEIMSHRCSLLMLILVPLATPSNVLARSTPASDPQAVAYAAQSIAAMNGGTTVSDVTVTGSVTWMIGPDTDTGTATLLALGTGESRMDLALSSGTRTEIRDASTGVALGKWIAPNGSSGMFASQNCMTDAAWFFPALGSLTVEPNTVLLYVGQEVRNGETVQHVQSYVYQANWAPVPGPTPQQLSAMDFYLDATTLLPSAITFSAHPDNDMGTDISTEVDFSNYQTVNGALVPFHVQKYFNGELILDLSVTSAVLNSGLPLSDFSVQ